MSQSSKTTVSNVQTPLHELISAVLGSEHSLSQEKQSALPFAGTLQPLNQRLKTRPMADFLNYTLRGVGQVIFVNNPVSGFLILLALFSQGFWVGLMSVVGVLASTATALLLQLDRETLRNGIFGYNGLLVGAALATFSDPAQGWGAWGWTLAVVLFAAFTTFLMKTFGVWWAKTFNSPPLTLPFNIATLLCLALVSWVPQSGLVLGSATPSDISPPLTVLPLTAALPIGFGQVFLADQVVAGGLIVLAVALCTPLGALVGLLGSGLGLLAGLMVGISPEPLYAGLWGYNAVLCAMAIGGVFYAPTVRSILIGAIAAFISALVGSWLGLGFSAIGLPVLTVPFCLVTIASFMVLQRSLPSVVPVALHAVTSPEEHRKRYQAAKSVITNFRRQLVCALSHQPRHYLFNRASSGLKGDLRYLFNLIDTDQSNTISTQELSRYLHQAGQVPSEDELIYLFSCMDADSSGTIDFEEFGELMLRHRRLMANYQEFATYFLPIDANGDDAISRDEMNVALASVGTARLSPAESTYLDQKMGDIPLTWERFIEMLLVT